MSYPLLTDLFSSSSKRPTRRLARNKSTIESLEPRRLLSISASSLPLDAGGAVGTMDIFTESTNGTLIATENRLVANPTTFNGNAVSEIDTSITSSDQTNGTLTVQQTYIALTAQGWVTYGMHTVTTTNGGGTAVSQTTDDVTYSPPQLIFPTTMDAGTSYSSTVTENDSVTTNNSSPVNSTATVQTTVVLTSETLQAITVPWSTLGTYDFKMTTVRTPSGNVQPTTTNSEEWISPNVGIVKVTAGGGEEVLTSHAPAPVPPGGGGGGGGIGEGGAVTPTLSGNLPESLIAGAKALISQVITLADSGAAYAESTTAALFLATGTSTDANSIALPAKVTKPVKLKTGTHTSIKLSLKSLPATVPPGVYHIIAQVTDSSGNVSESASAGTITVAPPQIDLGVAIGKFTTAAKHGKKFTETIIVTNTGNTAATGPLAIQVQTSPDANPANGTSLANLTKQINLKPNKSLSIVLSLLAPSAGSFFLIFTADPSNTFADINLANNTAISSGPVTVS